MHVVIAEDNALLRDGLSHLLAEQGIDVVAAVADADALLEAVARFRPEVAIIDVRMPPTHTDEGLRAAITIRTDHRATATLVLSQWLETSYARDLLSTSPDHVGYLLKDRVLSSDSFIDAVRRVAAGGTALDPEVVSQLLARQDTDDGLNRLTQREYEILSYIAEGLSNAGIAKRVHLVERTVEKNVTAIFAKLDLPPSATDHRRVLAVLRFLQGR